MKIIKPAFLIFLFPLLLSSCLVERQLAGKFIAEWKPPAVLVMAPEYVLKENLKAEKLYLRTDLSPVQKDSAAFYSSLFLKEISDSLLIETYVNAFIKGLRDQGYVVFVEADLDTFLTWKGEAYVFNMAQLLLEEYIIPLSEHESFDDTLVYYKKFELNALSVNSWFELSPMNAPEDEPRLLYASHYLHDYLKGRFTRHPIKGTVVYKYEKRPVEIRDVYRLAEILGRKYAGWLTDYFVNSYIEESLPEGLAPEVRYTYDPVSGKLKRSWEDRFMEMDP